VFVRNMRFSLVALTVGQASALVSESEIPHLSSSQKWKQDCKRPHAVHPIVKSLAQFNKLNKSENPGAGIEGYDSLEPFKKVYKDGFMMVDCVKDAMYESGDKFGNNKHSYKMGPISNTSIVHYAEVVAKEDRKPMTHAVCFEFCRGLESMVFFGINNGRDCYCTPYYKAMASDDSTCDATCEGDSSSICGSAKKSTVFSMHSCDDTDKDVEKATTAAKKVREALKTLSDKMVDDTKKAEADAVMMQKSFGAAGDPDISGMLQQAKAWAGETLKAGQDGQDMAKNLKTAEDKVTTAFKGNDMSDYKALNKVETAIKALTKLTGEADGMLEANSEMWNTTQPPVSDKNDWEKTYYPIMYFVDKEFDNVPATCSGELLGKPVLKYNPDECAAACDSLVGKCVGFAFLEDKGGVCFLYSKFKTAQYYTGCGGSFLQTKKALTRDGPPKKAVTGPFEAQCVAKLQFFEGTSLKPNIKCPTDNCLKELTKANRCFKK